MTLSIGIIGLGGAGRAHARRFARHRRVDSVIAFDPQPVTYRRFEVLDDLDALLARVDAVSICTPDHTHFDLTVRCLDAGKHVLVEKPMTASAAEARELEGHVRRHPELRFAVHHQMRCVPAFQRARRLIRDGALGDVFYIEANYWHDNRERNTRYDDWRIRPPGQSIVFGGACHPLDLLMDLVDAEVAEHHVEANHLGYRAYPAPYTAATVMLRFANGVVAKCHTNNCVVHPQLNDLVVLGDAGSYVDGVLYRDGRFHNTQRLGEVYDSLSLRRQIPGKLLWSPAAHALTACATRLPFFRRAPFTCYNHERASRAIVDNFVSAVLDDAPVQVGYADGLRVIELCEAIERSITGAPPAAWRAAA